MLALIILKRLLKVIYANKYIQILLLDKNNNIILEKHGEEIFSIHERGYKADKALFSDGYSQRVTLDGKNYRLDRITLEESQFAILMVTSEQYIWEELIKILLIIFIVSLVIIGLIIYAVSKLEPLILSPLDLLVEGIAEVTRGNYSNVIEFEENVPVEIELIKNEVNFMSKEIMTQTSELMEQTEEINAQYEEINAQYEEINALYEETTAMNESLNEMVDKLKESNKLTVQALSNAIEANDPYTKGHCERVKNYAIEIANELGYSETSIQRLEYAAILHDVGKVGIPSEILRKEGKLTDLEYEIIKKHPEIGYVILKEVPYLEDVARIVFEHHEWVDGTGYPEALSDENIHGMAKILCVADAYDAMTSERPYRKNPLSNEEALNELKKNINKQFDPEVVNAFIKIIDNFL